MEPKHLYFVSYAVTGRGFGRALVLTYKAPENDPLATLEWLDRLTDSCRKDCSRNEVVVLNYIYQGTQPEE